VIVYRTEASTGDGLVHHFDATLEEAKRTRASLVEVYAEVRLERVEIPPGREGIVAALNMATASAVNWEGERIA